MRASSDIGAGALVFLLACSSLSACGIGDAERGESCDKSTDCIEALQCFEGVCAPRCQNHVDCGGGYTCDEDGICHEVESSIGKACYREIDCGPGQACKLQERDVNGDGTLAGTCQPERQGAILGEECAGDDECRTGICSLGYCTQMCTAGSDCPPPLDCALVPRVLDDSTPRFGSCMPSEGVLRHDFSLAEPSSTVAIPVPSSAISFSLVAQIDEEDQVVGATRLVGPDGAVLYTAPSSPEEFYANPIRYQPQRGVSTLFVPNTPSVVLSLGVYWVEVQSQLLDGSPGTAVPRLRVLYKLDSSATLDLHFHFVNLADHPCGAAFDGGVLDATSAPESDRFEDYTRRLRSIFLLAGIDLGEITYEDIRERGDLDAIERDRAGDLFAVSTGGTGVNVFLVRSIYPLGVQAVIGGTPGPPLTPGTAASGVAISVDTLCYRDWADLARITAHAIARQMGLYNNLDPAGHADPIPDSDEGTTNLMFFSEDGGASLSNEQASVLRLYPGLR